MKKKTKIRALYYLLKKLSQEGLGYIFRKLCHLLGKLNEKKKNIKDLIIYLKSVDIMNYAIILFKV